jgi:hypothetical protein
MWLLIVMSCELTKHECVQQKTTWDSQQQCVTAAERMQSRLDERNDRKFVIICREVE